MAETFFYFHPVDNVAPAAAVTVQTGSEDTDYPKENLTDLGYATIAAPAKLTGTTGAFLLDWGSAQRVDYVVLWHNFDAALAVSVQMHATNAWGGPTVTTSPTIPAKRADGYTRKVGVDLRAVSGYSTSGFRYLRINISGTNSVPLGLKVMAYAQVRQLARDFQWGVQDDDHQIGIDMKTDAGVPWAYDLTSAPRVLRGSALLSDADAETVREWHRASAGVVKPFVLVPEPSGTDAWLVRWLPGGTFAIGGAQALVSKVSHQRDFIDVNQTQLAFEEISAGDPEWV
jgi:hypothetical protein